MVEKKSYGMLDICKFCCALLILFYHFFSEHGGLPGNLDELLSLYAVAVALFMTISGFLTFDKLSKISTREDRWKTVVKQEKRLLTIYLLWSVPYLIYQVFTLKELSFSYLFWKVQGWIFNSTFYTIWFIPSLAIGLLLAFWLNEKLSRTVANVLAFGAYAIGALMLTYSFVGEKVPWFNLFGQFASTWFGGPRGGIFFGFPLVVLGARMVNVKERMRSVPCVVLSIFFGGCMLVEAIALRRLAGHHTGIDMTVSMIPLVFCILGFLLSIPIKSGKWCVWMRKMSVLIFMTQRLFLTVIPSIIQIDRMTIHTSILFFMMCGGTLLFSILVLNLGKKIPLLRRMY